MQGGVAFCAFLLCSCSPCRKRRERSLYRIKSGSYQVNNHVGTSAGTSDPSDQAATLAREIEALEGVLEGLEARGEPKEEDQEQIDHQIGAAGLADPNGDQR